MQRPGLQFEEMAQQQGYRLIGGVDEAGRGPLAGPVVAASVWLRKYTFSSVIRDSKLLSASQRNEAYQEILQNARVGLGIVGEDIIDEINILEATALAMKKAINNLLALDVVDLSDKGRSFFIVDGRIKLDIASSYICVIHGESQSLSVACASIVAKVVRDNLMMVYDRLYPQYGFSRHKGYGTVFHLTALKKWGPSPIHRRTFQPVTEMADVRS